LPPGFLAGYDAACRSGGQFGRLEVPAWGANTMRAEFAVLSGTGEEALGLDRFNPYHGLARLPLASQVWRLRNAGYRTICLHPFDRGFFRRDLAMPALGFERFHGRETLGGSRRPPYAADPDLAGHILRVLDEAGPRVFIFAITMGNHGPWSAAGPPAPRLFDPATVPQGGELLRYLDGLRRSDEMLRRLIAGLEQRRSDALLGWYGDHLPSLPLALRHFGLDDWASDYAVWSAGTQPSLRRDLAARELGRLLVDGVLRAQPARDGVVAAPLGA
jgi:sulfatase-like protein